MSKGSTPVFHKKIFNNLFLSVKVFLIIILFYLPTVAEMFANQIRLNEHIIYKEFLIGTDSDMCTYCKCIPSNYLKCLHNDITFQKYLKCVQNAKNVLR